MPATSPTTAKKPGRVHMPWSDLATSDGTCRLCGMRRMEHDRCHRTLPDWSGPVYRCNGDRPLTDFEQYLHDSLTELVRQANEAALRVLLYGEVVL